MTSSYTWHQPLLPELKRNGFTSSFMSEGSEKSRYNLVSWMNTLADWTWTGPADERPKWLNAVPPLYDENDREIDHSDFKLSHE